MSTKLDVGNLHSSTTEETLRQAFGDFGQVLDTIVMRDPNTGRSRGFGFVTFATSEEADSAIRRLNEQELDGRRIKVGLTVSQARQPFGVAGTREWSCGERRRGGFAMRAGERAEKEETQDKERPFMSATAPWSGGSTDMYHGNPAPGFSGR